MIFLKTKSVDEAKNVNFVVYVKKRRFLNKSSL